MPTYNKLVRDRRFSVDPELRRIQSDDLIVYDIELSEYIQRKMNRIQVEQPDQALSECENRRSKCTSRT